LQEGFLKQREATSQPMQITVQSVKEAPVVAQSVDSSNNGGLLGGAKR